MRLKDKIAIITGAGTGIGEAIAHKFAREGASLVLNGLPTDPVRNVAESIVAGGGQAEVHLGDVAEETEARACVDLAIRRFGRLDVLVNNAGIFIANAETDDYRIADFDRTVRNNLRTAFLMTKFALPYLQKSRGNIICAGSEAGFNGSPGFTPYGGSKAFLHAFTMGVALEQAKYGVRANCICHGPIDTAWTRPDTGPLDEAMAKSIDDVVPLGRRGTTEEMANIYAFIASDEASYVTGSLWLADGGVTPAKGCLGGKVPTELRRAPARVLPLRHSHDGENGKEIFRAKK